MAQLFQLNIRFDTFKSLENMAKFITFYLAFIAILIFSVTSSFKLDGETSSNDQSIEEQDFYTDGDESDGDDLIGMEYSQVYLENGLEGDSNSLSYPDSSSIYIRRSRRQVYSADGSGNIEEEGSCILGDSCGLTDYNFTKSCSAPHDHTKFQGNEELIKVLSNECPELFSKAQKDDIPQTCCTPDDLIHMQANVQMARSQFTDCPSCVNNIIELVCHFRCAPNQDKFLEVTTDENGRDILAANYYVTKNFMEATLNSCKDAANYTRYMKWTGCENNCYTMDALLTALASTAANQYSVNFVLSNEHSTDSIAEKGKKMYPAHLMIQGSTCKK